MPTSFRTLSFALLCLAGAAMPLHASVQDDESYALVRDGQRTTFVGRYDSSDTRIDALKQQYPGNFIWYRHGGKAYIVRDPATLNQVAAAWAPTDKLGADMNRLDAKMRVQSDAMSALGRDMTAVTHGAKAGNMEAIGKQMDAQGKTMDQLGKEMDALGKQMDVQSKQADATARRLLESAIAKGAALPLPIR